MSQNLLSLNNLYLVLNSLQKCIKVKIADVTLGSHTVGLPIPIHSPQLLGRHLPMKLLDILQYILNPIIIGLILNRNGLGREMIDSLLIINRAAIVLNMRTKKISTSVDLTVSSKVIIGKDSSITISRLDRHSLNCPTANLLLNY